LFYSDTTLASKSPVLKLPPAKPSGIRRGILGGTFNPVHWGHVQIAIAAMEMAHLEQVIWIPASAPPHRQPETLVPFVHRVTMLEMAIAPYPWFTVSTVEQQQVGKSYACYTLRSLQKIYPDSHWFWIVGLDTFQTLPRWHSRQAIVAACDWLIFPRRIVSGGMKNGLDCSTPDQIRDQIAHLASQIATEETPVRWQLLPVETLPISSRHIRQCRRDRQSIRALVPAPVENYISVHQLYVG
jgi:nicotinate-nucleotide adenylyltransferase